MPARGCKSAMWPQETSGSARLFPRFLLKTVGRTGIDQICAIPHLQPFDAGQFHRMRQHLGAAVIVTGGDKFVGQGTALVAIADLTCRHGNLPFKALATPLVCSFRDANTKVE